MSKRNASLVGWIARILGILLIAQMTWGWWDEVQARGAGGDWFEQWAILTHALPIVMLVAAIAFGWRWPLIGALGFLGYAVVAILSYAPEWIYAPLISGPPLVVGALFLIDWWVSRHRAAV